MPARRCSSCALNWPADIKKYRSCPQCDEKTDWVSNSEPMDDSEVNHREFDVFCKKLDAEREAQLQEFEAAVEAAPSIPDPSGAADLAELPAPVKADEKPEGD